MNRITTCRACGSPRLQDFLDLGDQHLSDFKRDGQPSPKYPLVATFCEDCTLVQLRHTTPQSEMYHERYGFKSGVSDSIRHDLDDVVTHAFQYKNDPATWLDIASNDGTLLSFVPKDIMRVGVDPVKFLCEEAKEHADLIINDYFSEEAMGGYVPGEFDVITSISCFYDMPEPRRFVQDVVSVLDDKGVWIIQQNYLLTSLQLGAVDNFCHEHLEYYTLRSLENLLQPFGLEVNEVMLSTVNGGSIRTVVSKKGVFPVTSSVEEQRKVETAHGIDFLSTYEEFAARVNVELVSLRKLVSDLNDSSQRVAILGASTRGSTIWQSAGIDHDLICYAVERNPAKVGAEFTAIGVPIVSEEHFRQDKPEYAIIGPWFFAAEIIDREKEYLDSGGHLIIPLPTVRVIGKDDALQV